MTNGGFQSTLNENFTRSTAIDEYQTASTSVTQPSIIHKISVTSTATNYEILSDDRGGFSLTQTATTVSEPYFDSQTPKNVTGLVGKLI
jgi:hypothetical protein